jgi:uncharacterized protein YidB (DUF937 family)
MSGLEDILGGMLGGGGGQGSGGSGGGGLGEMLGGLMGGGGGGGGGMGAGGIAALAATVGPLLMKGLSGGGLQKMLGSLQGAGMEDKAQSWVSTGENKPISAGELEKVFGTDEIDKVAAATGADRETAANMLAQALPQVVDQVTPDGKLPDQSQLDAALGKVLEGK